METFGKRLAALRKSRGLTQGQFAEKIGMAQSTVASWETGVRDPDTAMLSKLARYFDVSSDYLLGNSNQQVKRPDPITWVLDSDSPEEVKKADLLVELRGLMRGLEVGDLREADFPKDIKKTIEYESERMREVYGVDFDPNPRDMVQVCREVGDLGYTVDMIDMICKVKSIYTGLRDSDLIVPIPIVGRISCGKGSLAYEEIEGYEPTQRSWLNGGEYFYLRAKGDSMTGARIQEGDLLLIRQQEDVEDGEIAAVLIDDDAVLKRVFKRGDSIFLQSENPNYPPIILSTNEGRNVKIIGKLKKIVVNV